MITTLWRMITLMSFQYILLFRKDCEVVGLNERLRWILSNGRLSSIFCLQVPEVFRRSIFQTALWRDVYQAGWIWDQLHYNSGCDWSQWRWCYSLPSKQVIKINLLSYWLVRALHNFKTLTLSSPSGDLGIGLVWDTISEWVLKSFSTELNNLWSP